MRGRERDEERVTLRVDLDAAMRGERFAQDAPMLGERLCVVSGAERVQELRRAHDVGEEEGDGAGREIAAHGLMLRPERTRVTRTTTSPGTDRFHPACEVHGGTGAVN